jgi:hypothetical protein
MRHRFFKYLLFASLILALALTGLYCVGFEQARAQEGDPNIDAQPGSLTVEMSCAGTATQELVISNSGSAPLTFDVAGATGLVLWNKLGSDYEVTHSEIGLNGTVVGGAYAYESARFGGGYVRKDVGLNYVSFPASLLDALTERGTIELWINPKVPVPIGWESGDWGLIGNPYGHYGVSDKFNIAVIWDAPPDKSGFLGIVGFDQAGVGTPGEPSQYFATAFTPFHVAISWDIAGIDGSADTIRVYRDGEVVSSSTEAWNPSGTDRYDIILGYGPDWDGKDKFISDNIKIWNYAKTDFSDRFIEAAMPAWLSVDPVASTVDDGNNQAIQVTFNASGLQPGIYSGVLPIRSNDPDSPVISVPVSMTISPTETMGWVEGKVTHGGFPIIASLEALGQLYQVMSEPTTGFYKLWLEPGVFTLQVTTPEKYTFVHEVEISTGQGATQDFAVVYPDDIEMATVIENLPFQDQVDITNATIQPGERVPTCAYWYTISKTTWFAFTPVETVSLMASSGGYMDTFWAVYSDSDPGNLYDVTCGSWGSPRVFQANAGTTYYFQVGSMFNQGGQLNFWLEETPPPVVGLSYYPDKPAAHETVYFYDGSYDPANMGISSSTWDFGDGVTAEGSYVTHNYIADGDYTVEHVVTTYDGRAASISQTVSVRTVDVGIIKFTVPQTARAGQTRSVTVGVKNVSYPEWVIVELSKSIPGGYTSVGYLEKEVPVRGGNRTTDFTFTYTFTDEDVRMGKVTFMAQASIQGRADAFPGDNVAISLPVKVSR